MPRTVLAPASAFEATDANQVPPTSPSAPVDRVFCPPPSAATLDDGVDKMPVVTETALAPTGAAGAATLLDLAPTSKQGLPKKVMTP